MRPDFVKMRFPAVIDKFARTLAAPITAQKYNTSICGRIGANCNIRARKLYFDSDSKCIKETTFKEGSSRFTASPELLVDTATDAEELQYLCSDNA
jgi:dynein heavy chain